MSNHSQNINVFSKEWFKLHQSKLITVLNTPIVGKLLRKLLAINYDGKLDQIGPNFYRFNNTFRFFGIDKFAFLLHKRFKYAWTFMHWMDEIFLDKYVPQLSFGFDSYLAYTSPGTGNYSDGHLIIIYSNNWSNIRSASSADKLDNDDTTNSVTTSFRNTGRGEGYLIDRAFFVFDCQALYDDYSYLGIDLAHIITSSKLYFYPTSKTYVSGGKIMSGPFNPSNISSITVDDYNNFNFSSYSEELLLSNITLNTYNSINVWEYLIALNIAAGYNTVPIGLLTGNDVNDSPPSLGTSNNLIFRSADYTGTSTDPYLEVIVESPPKGNQMII